MGHLIIVNHSCAILPLPLHCLDQFRGGRLTGTDNIEHRIITIRCSRDANKISGNSFYVLSVLGLNSIGRFLLDEGLVAPEYVTEHYSVLIVFQRLKDLFYPISASRTDISVVERRYAEAFVLKKMD